VKVILALAAPVLLMSLSGPLAAQDSVGFQSPTGNIHCSIYTWTGTAEVRCDLREYSASYSKRPAGCELDWGMAFVVGASGPGVLGCVGDTMIDPDNFILPYGEAVRLGGISCVSAKTGMTCTNGEGHGFSVAKAKQRLF
jgi:hypothetical protein